MPLASAAGCTTLIAARATEAISSGLTSRLSLPETMRDTSSRSSMSWAWTRAFRSIASSRCFSFGAGAFSAQQQLPTCFFRTLQLTDVPRQLLNVSLCRIRLFQRCLDVFQISLVRETDDENDRRSRHNGVEPVSINKNRDDPSGRRTRKIGH